MEYSVSTLKTNTIQAATGTIVSIANGTTFAPAGHVIEVKSAVFTDVLAISSADTRTDITNLSLSITPSSTSSKILVNTHISYGGTNNNLYASGYLMRDSTDIGVGTTATANRQNVSFPLNMSGAGYEALKLYQHSITFLDSPNTTSQITYKVQVRHDINGTMYINRSGSDSNSDYAHRGISTLNIMEVAG